LGARVFRICSHMCASPSGQLEHTTRSQCYPIPSYNRCRVYVACEVPGALTRSPRVHSTAPTRPLESDRIRTCPAMQTCEKFSTVGFCTATASLRECFVAFSLYSQQGQLNGGSIAASNASLHRSQHPFLFPFRFQAQHGLTVVAVGKEKLFGDR
jgi:hypothetical protein